MWFTGIYAAGAIIGIGAAALGVSQYSLGGMPVSREKWFHVAAPLIAVIATLMGATCLGLRQHRRWSRPIFMAIWPVIILDALVCGLWHAVPWPLAIRAVIDASIAGMIAAWVVFGHEPSRKYFSRIKAGRPGS